MDKAAYAPVALEAVISHAGNYLVRKSDIKEFGLNPALIIGWANAKDKLMEASAGGWIKASVYDIGKDTGLSSYQQRKAMQTLEQNGLIEVDRFRGSRVIRLLRK